MSIAVRWMAAALLVLCRLAGATAVDFTDDSGRHIHLPRPAQRVITLAPNLTEFVYAVGGGAQLVGTVTASDYPEQARSVAHIGDYQRLDVERILDLKPDLVLVWLHGNGGRELAQLEAAGLTLVYLEPRRLDDIAPMLERVGLLLGHESEARQAAASLRKELADLRNRYAGREAVSVFYQVWTRPLMTLNDKHLTSDVIRSCGGRNVFGALGPLVPQLSTEAVVAARPEVMLTAREAGADATEPTARREGVEGPTFAIWSRFSQIPAVRRDWLYSIPGDLISRQGPRVVQGVRALCEALDEVRRERKARP